MDYFNHIDSFQDDLRIVMENELYADAMRLLLSMPDDSIKWETLGDICHKINLADHALAYWLRADSLQAAEKAVHHKNDQTWIFAGPELQDIDQLPKEGHYSILRLFLPEGDDRYHIQQSLLFFFFGASFGLHPRPSSYLDFFLKEENSMVAYDKSDLKAGKQGARDEVKRLVAIKEEIVRKIPELAYCLQPNTTRISINWREKNFAERDKNYLKKTLEILSRKWYPSFAPTWSLRFQPLDFEMVQEGEATVYKANLTQMVPFKQMDEHTFRTYGVEEFITGEWEEGIWVEVREEKGRPREILLKCKRSGMPKGVPASRRLSELQVKVEDEKTMEFHIDTGKTKAVIDHLRKSFS